MWGNGGRLHTVFPVLIRYVITTILGNQVSCFLPERVHIFPSLPFIRDAFTEAFLVALDVSSQIQFSLGFSFPYLISAWTVSLYSLWLPPSTGFLLVFEFVLVIHADLLMFLPGFLCWDALLLSLQKVILKYQLAFLVSSSLQGFILWNSTKQTWTKEAQSCPWASHSLMAPILLVRYSTSPWGLPYCLEKEVIFHVFQELPALLMPCCVVPPTDIGVVEDLTKSKQVFQA